MKSIIALIFVLLCSLSSTSSAQDWEKGWAAYKRGDYATALREWRPLADQGHASAQNNLGTLYVKGAGVPQDYAVAVKWYRRAADQGYASAQNSLGALYDKGLGVPQDYAEAVKWYRRAADQGAPSAQFNLGTLYDKGEGVPQDYAEAYIWYSLSAAGGDKDAPKWRDKAAARLSPDQLRDAQREAKKRWERIQALKNKPQ